MSARTPPFANTDFIGWFPEFALLPNLTVATITGANAVRVNVSYLGVTTLVQANGTSVPATDAATLAVAIQTAFPALVAQSLDPQTAESTNVVYVTPPNGPGVILVAVAGCVVDPNFTRRMSLIASKIQTATNSADPNAFDPFGLTSDAVMWLTGAYLAESPFARDMKLAPIKAKGGSPAGTNFYRENYNRLVRDSYCPVVVGSMIPV